MTGVPAPIIQQMQKAVAQASQDPTVVARLAPLGTNILGDSTESFAKFLDEQRDVLTRLIADANIKLAASM